jgi:serine/threonine-protein kinase
MNLGPYEVLGEIGRGGMGVVLRARARDIPAGATPIDVAIKLIPARWNLDLARFEREKKLLAALGEAEGFVPLLDAGDSPHGAFLVMPLLPGGTLRERLAQGPMPVADVLALARRLAASIGEAHARGIVHRDLKPENVIFTEDGRALVADLGLGKQLRRDPETESKSEFNTTSISGAGEMIGTVGYMAPEQLNDARAALPAADVFALGAILYECLAGRRAFEVAGVLAFVKAVEERSLTPLRSLRPEVPEWLARAIERALAKDPGERFADGLALRRALEPPRAPRRWLARAAAFVLLAGAGAAAFALFPRLQPATRPLDAPAWYLALPAKNRPSFPLPRGLAFGAAAGEYRNEKDGSVLVFVPGGPFRLGCADGEPRERPVRRHTLPDVFVGKYEVTNAQFAAFVAATGYLTQAEVEGSASAISAETKRTSRVPGVCWRSPVDPAKPAPPDHPVVQVSWHDARSYCRWAGLRLPTEAEWEKAASWDPVHETARRFAWGGDLPGAGSPRTGNFADESLKRGVGAQSTLEGYDDGFERCAPVGSFPAGASFYGALDMIGNVSEWCADGFDLEAYARTAEDSPFVSPAGGQRVHRGGSWGGRPEFLRASFRGFGSPYGPCEDVGFRVARGLSPEESPALPLWYRALPPGARPPVPLPDGVVFGAAPGEYVNEEDGSVLVFVPARTYERTNPRTKVTRSIELSAYFLGKYEVTNQLFERFVKATGYVTSAEKPGNAGGAAPVAGGTQLIAHRELTWRAPQGGEGAPADHPVTQVSAEDGDAYCAWAGLRLPTEAEWESAAGWDPVARVSRTYAWGDTVPGPGIEKLGNLADESCLARLPGTAAAIRGYDDGWATTSPVGSFPRGAAPCGALDMTGNAREWCADAYESGFYDQCAEKDPVCKAGKGRVMRGGGWHDGAEVARIDRRPWLPPDQAVEESGFRVARSIRSSP